MVADFFYKYPLLR